MFHTLQEQPSELHNLQHFLHHHQKLYIFICPILIQINSFLTSFHFCELPAWCKSTHLPLLTKLGDFESSWALKAWKSKLCSFCEIPAWWKSTHLHILTKLEAFESSKALKVLKTWKRKLCSFCELPTWWQYTQRPLLKNLGAFERSKF